MQPDNAPPPLPLWNSDEVSVELNSSAHTLSTPEWFSGLTPTPDFQTRSLVDQGLIHVDDRYFLVANLRHRHGLAVQMPATEAEIYLNHCSLVPRRHANAEQWQAECLNVGLTLAAAIIERARTMDLPHPLRFDLTAPDAEHSTGDEGPPDAGHLTFYLCRQHGSAPLTVPTHIPTMRITFTPTSLLPQPGPSGAQAPVIDEVSHPHTGSLHRLRPRRHMTLAG